MSLLSFAELVSLATRHGFDNPRVAAAVAMAESGGDPSANGDAQFGGSHGLWQINLPAHPEFASVDLFDPDNNAKAALAISNRGKNWEPWTTYRNGAFRKYLQNDDSALDALVVAALVALVAYAGRRGIKVPT